MVILFSPFLSLTRRLVTRVRFVSLKKPLFSSRTFYFSFVLFINILRKNFMADWCVRLEFESVHQVCDCFVVPLSLRGRLARGQLLYAIR